MFLKRVGSGKGRQAKYIISERIIELLGAQTRLFMRLRLLRGE